MRGRPRTFVETEALDLAMGLFWRMGYEGTSMDALTGAMGISRSSLYQSFGNKEALFLSAVEHYARTRIEPLLEALDSGGGFRSDLAAFLDAVVRHATADPERLGCLVASVLSDAAGSDPRLRAELGRRFAAVEARIAERVAHAQSVGEMSGAASPATVAAVVGALARGLMLSARAGVAPETLRDTSKGAVAILTAGLTS